MIWNKNKLNNIERCQYCEKENSGGVCNECFEFSHIYYDIINKDYDEPFTKNEQIIIKQIGYISNFISNNTNFDKKIYIIGRDKILKLWHKRLKENYKKDKKIFDKFINEK